MNNKLLKDLIKKMISDCQEQIDDIKKDLNNENIKNINRLKININNLKSICDEDIKELLNCLSYKSISDRLDLERHILDLKNTIISNSKISNIQYSYISDLYNYIDYYLEHNSIDNNKMINDLNDMISMYNSLLNKLSMLNTEFIDEVDVLDLVLKNSNYNYYIKKDILRSILNYNRELFLKNF